MGNIFCGYYSIISAISGDFDRAAIAIGLGSVLDGLDGRIARMMKQTSDFGVQLDSIADFGTFGVAPAILAFNWGLRGANGLDDLRNFAWITTFAFAVCGALRLARFNVQAQKPAEHGSKRYFVGLSIPLGALQIAAIVHFSAARPDWPWARPDWEWTFFSVVAVTAFLMISTIRYQSFKELDIMKRGVRVVLLASALLIALIYKYSHSVLLILAVAYAVSGPVAKLFQVVRRFLPGGAGHREPAHGNIKT
jgi:CDP-diacylglycerol--serine O-phosphatidyltransferase